MVNHLKNLYLNQLIKNWLFDHDDDPLWEVFIRFDDKKKLTAQAYSNVDNDYMYDAVLEYVDEVI